jgi:hypothetical protein
MAWVQESQYRHQYSTDGKHSMAWQPTMVWKADPVKLGEVSKPLGVKDWMEGLLGLIALTVTLIVSMRVSHIGWVEHLSTVPRWILLGITTLVSFVGLIALLETRIVRTLIKVGLLVLCLTILLHR